MPQRRNQPTGQGSSQGQAGGTSGGSQRDPQQVLQSWPKESKKVAKKVIDKYGRPDDVSDRHLVWYGNGPWKRTEVHKESAQHDFPVPHEDIVEQTIDYRIRPENASKLLEYDGSLIPNRTRGELGVACHEEEANFLAINLAYEVDQGNLDVEEAKERYAENIKEFQESNKEEPTDLMQGFTFDVPTGNQGDPGEQMLEKPPSA